MNDLTILKYWNHASNKDIQILNNNLKKFYKLNIKDMSINNIANKIFSLLKINSLPAFILPMDIIPITPTKYGYMYRIRKVNATSDYNALSTVNKWKDSDFWNTPKKYVKNYGRLNLPSQSLLYLSFEYPIAMKETGINTGDYFVCTQFKSVRNINLVDMGFHKFKDVIVNKFSDNNGNSNDILKQKFPKAFAVLNIYEKFFKKEFSQRVNFKWQYKIPIAIAHCIYNPRNNNFNFANGWLYPSVKIINKSIFDDNICIWPKEEHNLLHLDKAVLVRMPNHGENFSFAHQVR